MGALGAGGPGASPPGAPWFRGAELYQMKDNFGFQGGLALNFVLRLWAIFESKGGSSQGFQNWKKKKLYGFFANRLLATLFFPPF